MTDKRAHAIISPSFASIGLNCSMAVLLKEKLPPKPMGAAADKGTLIHEQSAKWLKEYLRWKLDGTPRSEPQLPLDLEMVDISRSWVDIVWEKVFNQSITGKAWGIEDRLVYSEELSIWGTADVWMIATDSKAKRYAFIPDLKTGRIHVDERTPQLGIYGLCIRKMVRELGKDLDYIRVAVFQPYSEGEKWREAIWTNKQLDALEKKVLKLADAVFSNKAKYKVGDWCQYCPAQLDCPAYKKTLSLKTSLTLIDTKEIVFPEIDTIDDGVLVNLVLYEKKFLELFKHAKNRVRERLANDEHIPGIKAVEGTARRKMDPSQIIHIKENLLGFGINPVKEELRGIGELEKELKTALTGTNFRLKPKDAKGFIDQFTTKGPNPIKLVPEDDPRPAITSKLAILDNLEPEENYYE